MSRIAHQASLFHGHYGAVVCDEFVWDLRTHWCSRCGWNVAAHAGMSLYIRNKATIEHEIREAARRWSPADFWLDPSKETT